MTKPTPDSAIITQLSMLNDGGAALLAYLAAFAPAGGTTHNYMPSCGVTTVYSGCTIIEGSKSSKKAGGDAKAPKAQASEPTPPAPPAPPSPQELSAFDDDDDDDDAPVAPPVAPPAPVAPIAPPSAPPVPVAPPVDIFTIPGSIDP